MHYKVHQPAGGAPYLECLGEIGGKDLNFLISESKIDFDFSTNSIFDGFRLVNEGFDIAAFFSGCYVQEFSRQAN